LSPDKKVSYWADSPQSARAELKYHDPGNDLLTFWAYDDATSTFLTLAIRESLIIIDGREKGLNDILDKVETGKHLTEREKEIIRIIVEQNPDCLVYEAFASVLISFIFSNHIFLKNYRK
jgi:DNA-binding transcriptional regulator GbsR (MarR family)